MRQLLLASVTWQEQGKVLPAGLYEDMLPLITHERNWQELYYDEAVHEETSATNGRRDAFARASAHISTGIAGEFALIAEQTNRLWTHQLLRPGDSPFLDDTMRFFQADSPTAALKKYLLEGQETGERTWIKPLQDSVFYQLLTLLKGAHPESLTHKKRSTLFSMLCDHRSRMALCMRQWTPNINNYTESLADHAEATLKQYRPPEVNVRPA